MKDFEKKTFDEINVEADSIKKNEAETIAFNLISQGPTKRTERRYVIATIVKRQAAKLNISEAFYISELAKELNVSVHEIICLCLERAGGQYTDSEYFDFVKKQLQKKFKLQTLEQFPELF